MKVSVVLNDIYDDSSTLEFEIHVGPRNQGIMIRPKGYGDNVSEDSEGFPILIELFKGEPRVIVWDDINNEDATEIINLQNAKEELRLEH